MTWLRIILILFFGVVISCQNQNTTKTEIESNTTVNYPRYSNDTLAHQGVILEKGPWQQAANTTTLNLFADGSKLYLTWIQRHDSGAQLMYCVWDQNRWSAPQVIAQGDDWFINWADFPQFSAVKDTLIATFLQKSDVGTYTYDIYYTLKRGLSSWTQPKKLHRDTIKAEHGFVSIAPSQDEFLISWLDGRNTVPMTQSGQTEFHDMHHQQGYSAMTLRSVSVDFQGVLGQESLVDSMVCDCCQTAITVDNQGRAHIAYRGRSQQENRDILLKSGHPDKGWDQTQRTQDGWLISGCPVNGPSIDSVEDQLVLAWFSGAQDNPRVQVAFSPTHNLNLTPPTRMDSGAAIGRVDVVQLSSDTAVVTWIEPLGQEDLLRAQWFNNQGQKGPLLTIAKTSSDRATGFPRLVRHRDFLYLANTTTHSDKTTEIALSSWPISLMMPSELTLEDE